MRLLVFCSPDTPEAVSALAGHEIFLVLDVNQDLNGLMPREVLMLDFMLQHDLNTLDRDVDTVLQFARRIQDTYGQIDRVVSFNEATNIPAARIREKLAISGDGVEVASRYRDKLAMFEYFGRGRLSTPETVGLNDFLRSPNLISFPVLLKPRDQAASRGVERFEDREDLLAAVSRFDNHDGWLVQEFVEGDYYHIDVSFWNSKPTFIGVNRYLYHGMDWASGTSPMASCTEVEPSRVDAAIDAVYRIAEGFDVGNRVVHIEAFWTDKGFVFIEIASRPGGALIVPAHELSGGPNLEAESIRGQIMSRGSVQEPILAQTPHAWIVTPLPGFGPFVVRGDNAASLPLRSSNPVATIPQTGSVLHDRHRYRHPSGKFIFSGPDCVSDAVHVATDYRLEVLQVDVTSDSYWLR